MSPAALVVAAAVLVAGAVSLARPGYSPDEEFTLFAVRGISVHGLPLLPSQLLYDRGLAYAYLCWLAGAITGTELPAYRALSLASAIAALALVLATVRRLATPQAAWLAACLVAASVPFWAVATTARFYAPFLATYLLCVWLLLPSDERRDVTPGQMLALVMAAALCRWTHELAFTLLAIPALLLVFSGLRSPKSSRLRHGYGGQASPTAQASRLIPRDALAAAMALAAGLVIAQALIFAVHYLAPASGDTMIKRFFLWQVLNLFEQPPGGQIGVVLAAVVLAWLLAPRRAGVSTVIGLCGTAMILAFSLGRASQSAPFSRELAGAVLARSAAYPLDMFWHIAHAHPVMLALALALLAARLMGAGGEWTAGERAMHLAWVAWVLWFGVIDSGITINYLLLPVTLMLSVIAVDLVALVQHAVASWPGPRASAVQLTAAIAVLAIAADQWRGTGSLAARLAAARPTIEVPGIDAIRAGLQPTDRIACTDELACLILVGRADAWLALDDYVRERFVVTTRVGQAEASQVGVYAGAPAVFRPADLFHPGPDGHVPTRVLVVDVFKEYPVGNSSAWLPRAIDADGLQSRTLLETAQARVVQLSSPVTNAALR